MEYKWVPSSLCTNSAFFQKNLNNEVCTLAHHILIIVALKTIDYYKNKNGGEGEYDKKHKSEWVRTVYEWTRDECSANGRRLKGNGREKGRDNGLELSATYRGLCDRARVHAELVRVECKLS